MPGETRKQNMVHGALILTIATVVVKIIGAIFKVPLTNMIGGVGMGYFNSAYHLFTPLYTLSMAGLPVAISKMVAESVTLGRHREARKILKVATLMFLIAGIGSFLIMALGAKIFVRAVNNENAIWCVLALSPAVFFGCMTSSYRGYYEGMRNMYPTGISQVIEAVVKLAAGIVITSVILNVGMSQYASLGTVFGKAAASEEEARALVLPYAAAGAISGVTLSTLAGWLSLVFRHKIKGDGITREDILASPRASSGKTIAKKLLKIAIPVCIGSLALNISSLIDLASIMNRLSRVVSGHLDVLTTMYKGNIPEEALVKVDGISNYLYGVFSTLPVTFFNIVPAITSTFGISALPNAAAAWASRNRAELKNNVEATLKLTSIVAMPMGLGLAALSRQVLELFFSTRPQEVNIAIPMLQVMGIAVIFAALVAPANSLLQAIGKANLPVRFMITGAVAKLIINFCFVAVPKFNIQAAPYGTLVCYIIMSVLSITSLLMNTRVKIDPFRIFIKPFFAASVCALSAKLLYLFFSKFLGSRVSTLGAVCVAGVIYLITLFLIRGIEKSDIKMLPKGEKLVKVLEKAKILR